MNHIRITVVGDVRRDSRCLRFARTLAERHAVSVLALVDGDAPAAIDGMPLVAIRRRRGEGLRPALWRFWKEGARAVLDAAADLTIAADLYSLPVAFTASNRAGTPLIYDSRELYFSIAALESRPITQWYWRRVEARHAARAAAITTVNDSIRDILARRFPAVPVHVLRNLPSRARGGAAGTAIGESQRGTLGALPGETQRDAAGPLRRALGIAPSELLLLSQGGVQAGRGAFRCIDALASMERGVLVFLGDGPLCGELFERASRAGVANRVFHHPAVPSDELPRYTADADVGLCMIENLGRSYRLSLPNKLFEYIAACVPVLGSDFPEIRRIIDAFGVGLTADPADGPALTDAMRRFASDDALRARCARRCLAAREELSWEREKGTLLALCDDVLHSSGR